MNIAYYLEEIEEEEGENICQNETRSSVEWSEEAVLLLLEQYETNKTQLDKKNTMKKHIWTKISNDMKVLNYKYSWDQLQNKWKSLLRTYKSIKDHNGSTGRNRKSWQFFNRIDGLMAKNPTIEPPIVVHNGIINEIPDNQTNIQEPIDSEASVPNTPSSSRSVTPDIGSSISRKRKRGNDNLINELLQQNEKHHQEEMKEKRRFNDLLEILVNNLNKKE